MEEKNLPSTPVTVVGICGSLRPQSLTRIAVRVALAGAEEARAQTRLIDLRHYDLIFCDGKEDESKYPADVFKLRQEVRQAAGIILGTPEYHGSFSGVLKNAIDLMGFKEFEAKIIGLVGVSGGRLGAVNALNDLRIIGRTLHAWVVPEQVLIPQAWKVIDQSGQVKDRSIEERLRNVGRQVARFGFLHTLETASEFLQAWESAPPNPGG
jgi:FMN reductase